ncbi:hypothetical protein Pelo_14368 [Pelomyxa schiedti]|nr:hypothetical protein Pelo_14368 [Pelomyxa schiedti]
MWSRMAKTRRLFLKYFAWGTPEKQTREKTVQVEPAEEDDDDTDSDYDLEPEFEVDEDILAKSQNAPLVYEGDWTLEEKLIMAEKLASKVTTPPENISYTKKNSTEGILPQYSPEKNTSTVKASPKPLPDIMQLQAAWKCVLMHLKSWDFVRMKCVSRTMYEIVDSVERAYWDREVNFCDKRARDRYITSRGAGRKKASVTVTCANCLHFYLSPNCNRILEKLREASGFRAENLFMHCTTNQPLNVDSLKKEIRTTLALVPTPIQAPI